MMKYDPKAGILITDQMDAEIDRILPLFQAHYPVAREEKKRKCIGELKFVNPYFATRCAAPLMVDYDDSQCAGWGWASYYTIAVNAAVYQKIEDYQYRRVIAHELIHVIDPNRLRRRFIEGAVYYLPKDGLDKYLAQDTEFDAYAGMIAYSIRKNAKVWRGTENQDKWIEGIGKSFAVLDNPHGFIEEHKHAGVFDGHYAAVLLEYQKVVTADRFAVFAGRVRLALEDAQAHLEGKTETPFIKFAPELVEEAA